MVPYWCLLKILPKLLLSYTCVIITIVVNTIAETAVLIHARYKINNRVSVFMYEYCKYFLLPNFNDTEVTHNTTYFNTNSTAQNCTYRAGNVFKTNGIAHFLP